MEGWIRERDAVNVQLLSALVKLVRVSFQNPTERDANACGTVERAPGSYPQVNRTPVDGAAVDDQILASWLKQTEAEL